MTTEKPQTTATPTGAASVLDDELGVTAETKPTPYVRKRDYCGTCDADCEFVGEDDYCIDP